MAEMTSKPKSYESTWIWLYKLFAGLAIIILLAVHFVVNHLVAPGGLLSYADVVRYYSNPIIPVMEIAFLVFVVSHCLVGVRGILLDLHPSSRLVRIMNWVLTGLGVAAITYGAWLVAVIASRG
jgi:succinate dehydrogenase hydrophobic anchor subunit